MGGSNAHVAAHVGAGRALGVWTGSLGDRFVAAFASAEIVTLVHQYNSVPGADGLIVIEGETDPDISELLAFMTRGPYGFQLCDHEPTVALPRFIFRCAPLLDDSVAWIELVGYGSRAAGSWAGRFQAYPNGHIGDSFERFALDVDLPPSANKDPAAETIAIINMLRGRANLEPLAVAPSQQQLAREVAPAYGVEWAFDGVSARADDMLLEMHVGWELDGLVQAAGLSPTLTYRQDIAKGLVERLMTSGKGRETLFDPLADFVAVGTYEAREFHGGIIATYGVNHDAENLEVAGRLFERLGSLREEKGLAKATWFSGVRGLLTDAVLEIQASAGLTDAHFAAVGQRIVRHTHKTVNVAVWEVEHPEQVAFPPSFMDPPTLAVHVRVGMYRRPDALWPTYVVIAVAESSSEADGAAARP